MRLNPDDSDSTLNKYLNFRQLKYPLSEGNQTERGSSEAQAWPERREREGGRTLGRTEESDILRDCEGL